MGYHECGVVGRALEGAVVEGDLWLILDAVTFTQVDLSAQAYEVVQIWDVDIYVGVVKAVLGADDNSGVEGRTFASLQVVLGTRGGRVGADPAAALGANARGQTLERRGRGKTLLGDRRRTAAAVRGLVLVAVLGSC